MATQKRVLKKVLWETTKNIGLIKRQLIEGCTADKEQMMELVNSMLDFLHVIIKPEDESEHDKSEATD